MDYISDFHQSCSRTLRLGKKIIRLARRYNRRMSTTFFLQSLIHNNNSYLMCMYSVSFYMTSSSSSSSSSSCQCPAFTFTQKDGPYVGFQRVHFGVNFYISVGEDGLHLGEWVFRQSYSFLYACVASGPWGYCAAQVFKCVYMFYSFPFAKNITYRNI